jgi:hypothetical protein
MKEIAANVMSSLLTGRSKQNPIKYSGAEFLLKLITVMEIRGWY